MKETFAPGKRHIAVAHAFLTKAETSRSDLAAEIGTATQVSADVFDGFDYVALGHIHKPQDVGAFARYSGTPMPYSFGKEETQVKSVTLINTADLTRETVPLPLLHRRATLTGTLEELLACPCDEETRLGYVQLEVTDSYVESDVSSALLALYPNARDIRGLLFTESADRITLTAEELEEMKDDPGADRQDQQLQRKNRTSARSPAQRFGTRRGSQNQRKNRLGRGRRSEEDAA